MLCLPSRFYELRPPFLCLFSRKGVLYSLSKFDVLRPPFLSFSLGGGCFVLQVLCTETSISFLFSRKWVPCPPFRFYVLRPPFVLLSLGSGCFVLPPSLIYSDFHFFPFLQEVCALSSLQVLCAQTSFCFLVSRKWVLCSPSKFDVLRPPFLSFCLGGGCFVPSPGSMYSDLLLFSCL